MMKRILITPLDWGLGHATRCIPIIRELQRQDCVVLVAGSGDSLALLRKEFNDIKFFALAGYNPRYPLNGSMAWTMARQLQRFLRVIATEHKQVDRIIAEEKIDLLISDNRYGCWSTKIPCTFITHQSNILMPKRFGWLQHFVRRLSDRMINRFDGCWIPDFPGDHSLAGELMASGARRWAAKTEYIGSLSRFKPRDPQLKRYDVVAVLSGPEPQRTALENTILPQIINSALRFRVIRGLPTEPHAPADDRIVNFLTSDELQDCIEAADVIIARSGYSTVMDMSALGKRVIFIPTPGQTEQEYLARRIMEKGIAFSVNQNEFHLATALNESTHYSGFMASGKNRLLEQTISTFVLQEHSQERS